MQLPKLFQRLFGSAGVEASSKWQICTMAIMWALMRPWLVVSDTGTKIAGEAIDTGGALVSETTHLEVFIALLLMAIVQGLSDFGKESQKT